MSGKKEIINLLQRLISIDSQNPPGREREIAVFIKDYLKNIGVKSTLYEFRKYRTNLVCEIKSHYSYKRLLLTPHLDTVPISNGGRYPPLSGYFHNGKIYGRGATDCKSNIAVCLSVIKEIIEKNITLKNTDLIFAFTADEETGSELGLKPLIKYLLPLDYSVILDSDDFNIIIAQKGLLHLRIEIFGKAAHGAYPERGINAITKSIPVLKDITHIKFRCLKDKLLGSPTINIGKIEGGEKVNIVADYVYFDIDIRYLPSQNYREIIEKIRAILKRYKLKCKIDILAHQSPTMVDKHHFLITNLTSILKKNKVPIRLKGSKGATVITFLAEEGIPSFAFGFGSSGCAHTKNEYVKLDNLIKGKKILLDYLISLDSKLS